MASQVAGEWYQRKKIDDDITRLWEPYADPFIRCNIWHVRGRDCDLLVDSGLGIISLREAARDLFEKPVTAAATHTHYDHVGGLFEFEERLVHGAEAHYLEEPAAAPLEASLTAQGLGESIRNFAAEIGYPLEGNLLSADPWKGFDPESFTVRAAPATTIVADGDIVDLVNRHFEVIHLPGHSPGGIGLWEESTGTLFSGDAMYDGPPLVTLPEASVEDHVRTMKRLREMPIRVLHAGHEESFGPDRLLEIVDEFLALYDS